MSENMKASGIAWIGDIPESWSIKRVKYLATLKGRIGWQGLTSDEYTDEGPYLITGIDFENGKVNWDNCVHISRERWEEATEIQIQNGDLLITKDGTVGKVAIVSELNELASLNSGVLVIRTNSDFDRRFLFWVLQSEEFWVWFRLKNAGNSTIIHLYQNDFAEFCYTYPKTIEQTLIADFLDEQCEKIDNIATDIENQIEILQKYKKSLITETVTKGLDKSAPMKDSGIEWIGDIPEHWEVKRMQDIGTYKKGPFGSSITLDMFVDKDETTIKVYEQKNAIQGDATLGWYYISYLDYKNLKDFEVFSGDIIVSCAGTMGKCYIMPTRMEKGIINQALMKITLLSSMEKQYFLYLFDIELEYMTEKYSNGSAIKNIPPFSVLKKENIPLPQFYEQSQIAEYLDEQCSKIDSIIESKKEQLTKITQHKKSLIYEYVTGKKRVKGANINGN